MSFPFFKQLDEMDCGPTCLKMVAKHYGKSFSLSELRDKSFITREGVSLLGISEAAESIGFRSAGVRWPFEKLEKEAPLPCIAHWNQSHFIVIYKIKRNRVFIADPDTGLVSYSKSEFIKFWGVPQPNGESEGILLLLEPTPEFYEADVSADTHVKTGINYLVNYLKVHKKFIFQLFIWLLVGSLLQLILPFLTQSIVDVGIKTRDISYVYLILVAQLVLVFGRTTAEFFRGWLLVHLSARINLNIISDFLAKLMQLPMAFFDTKKIGDILQRIEDHTRVERFLNSSSLNILFSLFNVIVFGIVLLFYSLPIFIVFFLGSAVYLVYVIWFLKIRKELDNKKFNELTRNRSSIIQIVNGIHEIKLNNCEKKKRWEWERIQEKIFTIGLQTTRLQQWQEGGGTLINEVKNVIITFLAATSVINSGMSLGTMLAVQYIIGLLNGPIIEFVNFLRELQDARISLDRIGEIHMLKNEEVLEDTRANNKNDESDIIFKEMTFQYEGPRSPKALEDINITIEHGKVTAIVGASGSGKTTLLKLILKYYPPTDGSVYLGELDLANKSASDWRRQCGVVVQDGYIFSDTIVNNICLSTDEVNLERLQYAVTVANIREFIEGLPLSYNTQIGSDGMGLSAGQKQRILIARAVYKNPSYLFFDEATSALDANNEQVIVNNLNNFFSGKTVVVIAHRLSTVKNADKIIVLEKGRVIEQGNHHELSKSKGKYYELVKNQLELGE
ncbi:MAG: peptidase domain-containing ABC transporter [Bacteroidetes bacterium]|nr:peptidase domain-containing ABC transporter [Bacteroidota bacterium]